MPQYITQGQQLHFRQSNLPRMFFVLLGQLGVMISFTGSKLYPYAVEMSEDDFKSSIELAGEL